MSILIDKLVINKVPEGKESFAYLYIGHCPMSNGQWQFISYAEWHPVKREVGGVTSFILIFYFCFIYNILDIGGWRFITYAERHLWVAQVKRGVGGVTLVVNTTVGGR